MKAQRPYPRATITPKGEHALAKGHPWVYEAEVLFMEGAPGQGDGVANGSLIDVVNRKGAYLGTGLLSKSSKIRIRLITRNANDAFDRAFWKRKVAWAWEYRKTVMGEDASCCRVLFSEADGFPGLVVDRFNDVLVAETLSVGMEQLKPVIFPVLLEVLAEDGVSIRGLYERNDVATRKLEGLELTAGWFAGTAGEDGQAGLDPLAPGAPGTEDFGPTATQIVENGVRYEVDFENGQKTGFFLDQKYNRLAMQRICKGKRVLDCFTHMGTFALNAGIAGASDVTGLDISEYAVQQANANAVRNHLEDTVHFRCANVLDELPKLAEAGEKYDVVILDPPAFTKSREATKNAIKGYREINMKGLKLVKDGGYLATCSCSHFMTQELLAKTVKEAAKAAHKRLRQVEFRTQAPDHPILWANSANVPESYYLKFFIFQVVDEK